MVIRSEFHHQQTKAVRDHEAVAPERIWKWGAQERGAPVIFLTRPSTFWLYKYILVVIVSAFVIGSTVRSVSCLLFFYSRCPPRVQPFVKVGKRHVPPCPMESAPLPGSVSVVSFPAGSVAGSKSTSDFVHVRTKTNMAASDSIFVE